MKRIKINNRRTLIVAVVAAATICISVLVFSIIASRHETADTSQASKDQQPAPTTTTPAPTQQPKQAPFSAPSTPACKLFTQQLAVRILGNNAVASIPKSVIISETADMQVSSCVYTNGGSAASQKTVSFTARIATTDLGQSANSVEFGSGRTANAQTVPGFGQAAFWDTSTSTLHVLKNNSHYTIMLSTNTPPKPSNQSDTKIAADVIVPKL